MRTEVQIVSGEASEFVKVTNGRPTHAKYTHVGLPKLVGQTYEATAVEEVNDDITRLYLLFDNGTCHGIITPNTDPVEDKPCQPKKKSTAPRSRAKGRPST